MFIIYPWKEKPDCILLCMVCNRNTQENCYAPNVHISWVQAESENWLTLGLNNCSFSFCFLIFKNRYMVYECFEETEMEVEWESKQSLAWSWFSE